MKSVLIFLATLGLFAADFSHIREERVLQIDHIISIYTKRLQCLEKSDIQSCIQRYPQDRRSDNLAKMFAMSFPKAYYGDLLRKSITLLQKQKLCWGRAQSQKEARRCQAP